MAKTRMILFRVTESQHDRIWNNVYAKGYKSLASYMRYLALDKDMMFEQRFNEMYNKIVRTRTESNNISK